MLSRNFVFGAEDKNSFDMGFRGLKDHPQFFVCKSEVFFFKWSLITTPNLGGFEGQIQDDNEKQN